MTFTSYGVLVRNRIGAESGHPPVDVLENRPLREPFEQATVRGAEPPAAEPEEGDTHVSRA